MSSSSSNALVVRKEDMELALTVVGEGPVATIVQLQERIARLAPVANVLMPTISSPVIPAKMAVALSAVQIDVTTDQYGAGREVYFDRQFCNKDTDEVALGKVAILKILGAAGISAISSRRMDDGSDPNYVLWQVVLAGRDLTGQWQESPGTKELDYREGSVLLLKPEKSEDGRGFKQKTGKMMKMDDSAVAGMRRNMLANAETKAILRAARGFPGLALAQKYPRRVAAKLWIVPRLVPALDPGDPADMQFAREQAAGHVRQLYGGSQGPEPRVSPPPVLKAHHQPIDVTPVAPPVAPRQEPDEDFEVPELAPEAEEDAVCTCPCSCQALLTPEVARVTVERIGSPRCSECYPNARFNFDKHKDLTGPLGIKKHPDLTVEGLRTALEQAKR